MPGFFGIINNSEDISDIEIPCEFYRPVICDERKGLRYYFKRHVIPKFLNDKVFDENAATIIGTNGLLFNSTVQEKYGVDTNFFLIERRNGESCLFTQNFFRRALQASGSPHSHTI